MFRWLMIVLLAATVCVPLSAAQRGGRSFSGSRSGARAMHRFARGAFLGSPFFYSDYETGTEEPYVEETPPSIARMQRPTSIDDSARTPKPAPLLIEWRGDRYVRFGGAQNTSGNGTTPDYAEPKTGAAPLRDQNKIGEKKIDEKKIPSAVLVYRDGHRQEISGYAIAGGMIYSQTADWQNAHPTKPIPVSALDPVATVTANSQRGITFLLPSASNEAIASF
jgi:hypothetical protein